MLLYKVFFCVYISIIFASTLCMCIMCHLTDSFEIPFDLMIGLYINNLNESVRPLAATFFSSKWPPTKSLSTSIKHVTAVKLLC